MSDMHPPPGTDLGAVIQRVQAQYLRNAEPRQVFEALLPELLAVTRSEYGLIGEVWHDDDGQPFLKVFVLTDIAWNDETRLLMERHARGEGLEFRNLDSLLGAPVTSGAPVIANDPASDPRASGLPQGHPRLQSYLGVPLYYGGHLVGVVGLANRPGGYDDALLAALQPLIPTVGAIIGQLQAERARQRAEEALRRSAQLYRTTFEVAAVGIAHVALDGRFRDTNPRLCEILGRSHEELLTLRLQDLTDAPHAEREAATLRDLADRHRGHVVIDKRYLRPDGSEVWTVLTVALMRDPAGRPLQFVAAFEDITERKRVEAALRESEQRLRKLTDNVDGAFYLLRLGGSGALQLVYASSGMARLFQLPPEPAPPSMEAVLARVHPDDLPLMRAELDRAERELTPVHLSYRVQLDDGLHWQETQAIAERQPDGSALLHGFAFDVTHRKQYETALFSAEAAERANRAKTEFLSRMSHELRTPLNAVLGFAQLLQMDSAKMDDAQRQRVNHIERAGAHLLAMINDVLDLSRIEAGTMPLSPEPLEVAPVFGEALALVAAQAQQAQVMLASPLVEPTTLALRADRVRLRQVLVNLLTNAIKYNRRGGIVSLRAMRDGLEVAISVTDTGIGMTTEQLAHLWEPFNRLGAERTQVEGTGIGLALSQRMVQMMDGRIEVTSEAGRGSTFTVRFPAADTPAPPLPQVHAPAATKPAAHQRSVIYAEDNPINVELVQQVFQLRPQLHLRVARSGAEAIAMARADKPDLMLLDMHLGDMNGLEVARRLEQEGVKPIFVALSADVLPARVDEALQAGFADYLPKPLDVAALMRTMDRLLGPNSQFMAELP